MEIKNLLKNSREIWGNNKLTLADLGYNLEDCINIAIECQKKYKK